jgi:hypothetical protein
MKPLSQVKSVSTLEDRIYVEQEKYIEKRFGKDAAHNASYGWDVDVGDTSVHVSTKVYRHGILRSEAHLGDEKVTHTFEEFEEKE